MGASLSLTLAYHYAYSTDIFKKNTIPLSRCERCPCKKFFYCNVEEAESNNMNKTIYLRKLK